MKLTETDILVLGVILNSIQDRDANKLAESKLCKAIYDNNSDYEAWFNYDLKDLRNRLNTFARKEDYYALPKSPASEKIVSFEYPESSNPWNMIRRVIKVTEEDHDYVSGVDLQKEGFRKYLRRKMRGYKIVSE